MSFKSVDQIVKTLKDYGDEADLLMMLGSGWNHVMSEMKVKKSWKYDEVFGLAPNVPGHKAELILGKLGKKSIWVMAGRFHTYEGYDSEEVTRPVQAFSRLGVEKMVITSAAGALNEEYRVGEIVVLSDMLTLFCQSPLVGARFQDLSNPFDLEWRRKVMDDCEDLQIAHQQNGIYAYMRGPHYEPFADKRALRYLGADCVGMSTVPETIMARYLGVKVLGLSCVTNLSFVEHSHEEVVAAAEDVSGNMVKLLKRVMG